MLLEIWSYCHRCMDRTMQMFIRDEGKYEVYLCDRCKQEHRVAVR